MQDSYFTEREQGPVPQTATEIAPSAWRGLAALLRRRLDDGSFGAGYPEMGLDGGGPCGANEKLFWDAVQGEVPALGDCAGGVVLLQEEPPPIGVLMDLIEFCWRAIGRVQRGRYHSYFSHYHVSFDVEAGREEFEEDVNRIFRRNGLAYTLTSSGSIERVLPAELEARVRHPAFSTGDHMLDAMLDTARQKFLDPEEAVRLEALEKLWDAWERLKTIDGESKKAGVAVLLDAAAGARGGQFGKMLESEAEALTKIGNTFHIRHSETSQEPLANPAHVDYLFGRMFSFIFMLLQMTGKVVSMSGKMWTGMTAGARALGEQHVGERVDFGCLALETSDQITCIHGAGSVISRPAADVYADS